MVEYKLALEIKIVDFQLISNPYNCFPLIKYPK